MGQRTAAGSGGLCTGKSEAREGASGLCDRYPLSLQKRPAQRALAPGISANLGRYSVQGGEDRDSEDRETHT